MRTSDENPHIMQFLERGAPLERASAEERDGGRIDHQDNYIHVGFSSLKAMLDCRIAKVWQMEEDEGKRHSQHLMFGVSNHAVALMRGQLPHPVTSTEAGAGVCVELRALRKLRKK